MQAHAFFHAVLGCDTTSSLYRISKGSILKKFKEKVELQKAALIFDNPHSTPAQIDQAGESALVLIYNGKKGESLNNLRYKMALLPEEWGWTRSETGLHQIATNQPPAPSELLKIIRCNCATDCASAGCSY